MRLGVYDSEKSEPQKILISASWECEVTNRVLSDQLETIIDYSEIYTIIKNLEEKPHTELLEKLHIELKTDILKKFPDLLNLEIKIQKFPFGKEIEGSIEINC